MELAKVGLTLADVEADLTVDLWPDNADAVRVFTQMFTQWRSGTNGLIGLDYNVIPMAMQGAGVSPDKLPAIFQDLRVIEDEALRVMRARSKAAR